MDNSICNTTRSRYASLLIRNSLYGKTGQIPKYTKRLSTGRVRKTCYFINKDGKVVRIIYEY